MWQRTDNIFSSWQERFFVLTENSLYSFLRGAKNRADLERTVSKIKLSDVCGISLVDRKGQLMIKIVTKKNGRLFLRKQEGLSDWFEQIVQNGSALKFQNCNRKLENSTSLIETHLSPDPGKCLCWLQLPQL
eukprot:TRINITY_DN3336_c0_g2_i1.p1 TRINITY_DN3336_c0_g2~~TRINITY_DN3336_c0_g2_i1.p1  ORF type:complete len:132 (+),score=24.91 TRINITY_DN3336_c0_g2_i1:358-753(+)